MKTWESGLQIYGIVDDDQDDGEKKSKYCDYHVGAADRDQDHVVQGRTINKR